MKTFSQDLRLYFKFSKPLIPLWDKMTVLVMVNNLSNLVLLIAPLFVKVIFDVAYPNKDFRLFFILSAISFSLVIVFQTINYLARYLDLFIDQQINQKLYRTIYTKLQLLPIAYFHRYRTGDLIFRITQDVDVISKSIISFSAQTISSIVKIIVLLTITLTINPKLTLLALIGIPINFFQTHFFAKKLQYFQKLSQQKGSDIYSLLEERLSAIRLIKLFHKQAQEITNFLTQISQLFEIERKSSITKVAHNWLGFIISHSWAFVIGIYMGYLIINDQLSIGEVIAMTTYIGMLSAPFNQLRQIYASFAASMHSFHRISDILAIPNEGTTLEPIVTKPIKGAVTLSEVNFSYDGKAPVLQQLSFEVPAKTSFALVGRSGTGKTSIIDLLARFYEAQSGTIQIDKADIRRYPIENLRTQIGIISQDVLLLNGSIKDNLLYGLKKSVSDQTLEKVTKQADAYEFIQSLPNKYDSIIGPKGVGLSGGQKQRLAIARAYLTDPAILIFDEATASLDSESEKWIQKTIQSFHGKKTVIVIAHRLSSVKAIDQIAVLGDYGKICELGTFAELIAQKGVFYKLYDAQFGGIEVFRHQARLLFKAAERYHRPLSASLVRITNFTDLQLQLDELQLHKLLDELTIFLRTNIREVDICCHIHLGDFLVLLPETASDGAKIASERLSEIIRDIRLDSTSKPIQLNCHSTNYKSNDTVNTIFSRLNRAFTKRKSTS